MYSSDFDDDDDSYSRQHHHYFRKLGMMEWLTIILSLIGIIVVLVLLCRCCQRSKNQGQIITQPPPPAPPGPLTTAPYPQQQFVAAYPVSSPYHPSTYAVQMPLPGHSTATVVIPPYPLQNTSAPAPHHHAPTAPDLNALPPSYEQATGTHLKQSPYNPGYLA
ncbi:unnamed protein product [Diatraea saccharalis]|uniref:Uncharacterized protein n=1 Tax=Diatraea saccharalis TaxID=40085 RepID=A0A9N9R9H7_9NEOP|nr:unnamed protein product [Diatraea saccharalis]